MPQGCHVDIYNVIRHIEVLADNDNVVQLEMKIRLAVIVCFEKGSEPSGIAKFDKCSIRIVDLQIV